MTHAQKLDLAFAAFMSIGVYALAVGLFVCWLLGDV